MAACTDLAHTTCNACTPYAQESSASCPSLGDKKDRCKHLVEDASLPKHLMSIPGALLPANWSSRPGTLWYAWEREPATAYYSTPSRQAKSDEVSVEKPDVKLAGSGSAAASCCVQDASADKLAGSMQHQPQCSCRVNIP